MYYGSIAFSRRLGAARTVLLHGTMEVLIFFNDQLTIVFS